MYFPSRVKNCLTLASFQRRRPRCELPLLLCYPFPSLLPFILMRAQLIRKWNSFPKETGSPTMEAFFCQWLYWIPLRGHWAILRAISSIAPPPPHHHHHHHRSIACSLFFLSSRSHGLVCATVSFDPPPHPPVWFQMRTLTILHIDLLWQNHHLVCMLGLFNDNAEGTESRVTNTILPVIGLLYLWWTLVGEQYWLCD